MQMTNEERQDYQNLTKKGKDIFDFQSNMHPEWSFNQVMTKVEFEIKTDVVINKGGKNVNRKDPEIWLDILEGVRTALSKFKSIGRSIFIAIDSAITSLKGLIRAGIQRIGDVIDDLLYKIF